MFTMIYEQVFPVLGNVFGFLLDVANADLSTIITFVGNRFPFFYHNLFTGVIGKTYLAGISPVFNRLLENALRILYFGVPSNFPLWLATLYNVVRVYLFVAMINFVRGIF